MKPPLLAYLPWTCLLVCCCRLAIAAELPGPALPDGLGVNIHFTDAQPGEIEMIAQAGFRWVRAEFSWSGTEKEKGVYDFAAWDRLIAALTPHQIRAVAVLSFSNPHYDDGMSPASDEGRAAFARWAVAAAHRFREKGVLWEIYNEPNILTFWKPAPDVQQYIKLALEVGKAFHEAEPGELCIGPACSTIDFAFLEECFKAGLLEYWTAVSVHPYREAIPETVAPDYLRLRQLIDQYAPKGKNVPIVSGEWGYPSVWKNAMDETKQGMLLPRMLLTNAAHAIPLSIWYDWRDDGQEPQEPEHHYGTVHNPYTAGQTPVFQPKPAYAAAQTLTRMLGGYRFQQRIPVGAAEDFVLAFVKDNDVRWVAWTTADAPRPVVVPATAGKYAATAHTGEAQPPLTADATGLPLTLTAAPIYVTVQPPSQ